MDGGDFLGRDRHERNEEAEVTEYDVIVYYCQTELYPAEGAAGDHSPPLGTPQR